MGCDTQSCRAEIAGATGARYVVFGRLGKLGQTYLMQLTLFDSTLAKPIGREEARFKEEGQLPDQLRAAASRVLAPLGATPVQLPPAAGESLEQSKTGPEPESSLLTSPWLWTGATVIGLSGAIVLAGVALFVAGNVAMLLPLSRDNKQSITSFSLVPVAIAVVPLLGVAAGVGVASIALLSSSSRRSCETKS